MDWHLALFQPYQLHKALHNGCCTLIHLHTHIFTHQWHIISFGAQHLSAPMFFFSSPLLLCTTFSLNCAPANFLAHFAAATQSQPSTIDHTLGWWVMWCMHWFTCITSWGNSWLTVGVRYSLSIFVDHIRAVTNNKKFHVYSAAPENKSDTALVSCVSCGATPPRHFAAQGTAYGAYALGCPWSERLTVLCSQPTLRCAYGKLDIW